jgi:hypothetical protein
MIPFVAFAVSFVIAIAFARAAARIAERDRCSKLAASLMKDQDPAEHSQFWSGYNAACLRVAAAVAVAPKKGGAR